MQVTKLGFVLVFHLVAWDGGVSFLDQSESEVKENKSNPRSLFIWYSIETVN